MKYLLYTCASLFVTGAASAQMQLDLDPDFGPNADQTVPLYEFNQYGPAAESALVIPVDFSPDQSVLPFEVSFTPRINRYDGDGYRRSQSGGMLTVSSISPEDGSEVQEHGWTFFIASDGEQISIAPNKLNLSSPYAGARYSEEATIGEFQAGMSVKRSGTTYSIGYVQTEITTDNLEGKDMSRSYDFGGFTISRKF